MTLDKDFNNMKEKGGGLMEFNIRTLRFKDIECQRGCTLVQTSPPFPLVPQLHNQDISYDHKED